MLRRIAYLLVVSGVAYASFVYARDVVSERQAELQESDGALGKRMTELDKLRQEAARLEAQVSNLDVHDPVEVEATIRRSKRLVREGETVYRIQQLKDAAAPSAAAPLE